MTISADDFKVYLNPENVRFDSLDHVKVIKHVPGDHTSSIAIRSERDFHTQITIEFSLKFEHHKYEPKETVFQKEFFIEHHPKEKSRHSKPHVQIHIHGADSENKVGKVWINLELDGDGQYKTCIKGFFNVLDEIINRCKEGLDIELLNKELVQSLTSERELLLSKIKESLRNRSIEYKPPKGKTIILTPSNIARLLGKDKTLLPLFE